MIVGFSGTREGMTDPQRTAVARFLQEADMDEFHMGCCIGADAEAAASAASDDTIYLVGHPPDNPVLVSGHACSLCHELRQPRPYLERNRAIVDTCDVLVVAPKGPEERRSGAWASVRYARKAGKSIVICWPSGNVSDGRTEEPD